MREIKFNFYDNITKKYIRWEESNASMSMSAFITHEHLEFLQYTGLKDKNGRDIYEGDITDLGVIYHINGCFMVGVEEDINKSHVLPYGVYKGFSVIGNIYENPELLVGSSV